MRGEEHHPLQGLSDKGGSFFLLLLFVCRVCVWRKKDSDYNMALRLFAKTAFNTNSKSLTPLRAITAASFHTTSVTCQAAPVEWKIDSVRTGVIARKKGMTALWTESGVRIPVTVLQVLVSYTTY